MKKMTLFFALFSLTQIFAAEIPLRPIGTFIYKGEVTVTKKRSAVTVSHTTAEGKERIKTYKSQNFTCLRKNQTESLCQKNESMAETPEFAKNAVLKFLKDRSFQFSGLGEVELIFDGATTEWLVREDVYLGTTKIEMYKIVKSDAGWNISFPVSEEQPLGNMNLISENLLSLPLILQTKEAEFTVGYFLSAQLEKRP